MFPMEKLFPFSPSELQLILCGDQAPKWTRNDVLQYTEPKLGYTKERYDIHLLTAIPYQYIEYKLCQSNDIDIINCYDFFITMSTSYTSCYKNVKAVSSPMTTSFTV